MNSGGPPHNNGEGGSGAGGANGVISTESAIAALEQHDQLFHRQVMQLRQQQVISSMKSNPRMLLKTVSGSRTTPFDATI